MIKIEPSSVHVRQPAQAQDRFVPGARVEGDQDEAGDAILRLGHAHPMLEVEAEIARIRLRAKVLGHAPETAANQCLGRGTWFSKCSGNAANVKKHKYLGQVTRKNGERNLASLITGSYRSLSRKSSASASIAVCRSDGHRARVR